MYPQKSAQSQFKKICLEGSGKGRIELAGEKYTFGYESLLDRPQNVYYLALDFPIIGETKVSLSLDPKIVSRQIGHTQLVTFLKERLGPREDLDQIVKTIEEFFVFSSDFIRFKASNNLPSHFETQSKEGHFILSRETNSYRFFVDNFAENEKYFERTIFKIFQKSPDLSSPTMLLFLVPQSCDEK